jgi:hypothetical protein
LDTMLSSSAVYQVNATVEGRNLDEYAIVGIDSRIRPYFLSSIKNDPDVTGLVVYLKTLRGEIVSKKVRYVPGSAGGNSGQPISIDKDEDAQDTDAPVPGGGSGSPEAAAGQTESGQAASGEAASGSANSQESAEAEPSEEESRGNGSSENDYNEEDANAGQDSSEVEVTAETTAGGGLDMGPVYQIREMKTPSGSGEADDPDELAVYVSNLDGDMPALLFPEKLEMGIYILVFQVLGPHGVLSSSEKLAYYVSDAEFSLGDIQTYHSGDREKSGMVSPGSVIMLETRVNADDRLKPYIIWYSGKQRVREGPVSGGVDRTLWQAPGKTGFQAIRAEVFPFTPPESYKKTAGLSKELSLALSSKQADRAAGNTGIPQQEAVTRWYQLGGDFSDSLAPADTRRKLTPGKGVVSTWLPKAGIYGLAAGPADFYDIPGPLFVPAKELPGYGRLVFRLALESSGTVFSGVFALDRAVQTLKLDLSWNAAAGHLTLRSALDYEEEIQNLSPPSSAADGWITITVDFTVSGNKFWAELGLLSAGEESPGELAALPGKNVPDGKGIVLPGALTGNGVFKIGAPSALSSSSAASVSSLEAAAPAAPVPELPSSSLTSVSAGAAASAVKTEPVKTAVPGDSAPVMILEAALVLFNTGEFAADSADESAESAGEGTPENAEAEPVSGEPDKAPLVSPSKKDGGSASSEKDTDLTRQTEEGEAPYLYNAETLSLLTPEL